MTSSYVLRNSLFGATKVSNNTTKDPQKYNYSEYGIAFSSNKHPDTGGAGKNVIIFGCDMSDSKYENNKKQPILALGYGSIKKINDTEIYAEKSNTPDFTSDNKVTCLSLHYNGSNSFLYVNGKKATQFKAKDSITIYKH